MKRRMLCGYVGILKFLWTEGCCVVMYGWGHFYEKGKLCDYVGMLTFKKKDVVLLCRDVKIFMNGGIGGILCGYVEMLTYLWKERCCVVM